MKKLLSIILVIVLAISMTACGDSSSKKEASMEHPVPIADHVLDVGTITENNESAIKKYFESKYLHLDGGCSSVLTQIDGKNLMGRNLDLAISENAVFKFVLDINKYKAIGFTYNTAVSGLNYDAALKNGIDKKVQMLIPNTASDLMNEKGLYIQANMRSSQPGYEITGTNPEAKENVYLVEFPAYVATRCATVGEVVKLAKSVNIFNNTDKTKSLTWNFAFMIADAEGNYGLLEIAKNKVSFLPKQNGQANYYVSPKFAKGYKYGSGQSRFKVLNEGLDKVKTMDDMLEHMQKSYFSQAMRVKDFDKASYDVRSEYVHGFPVNDKGKYDKKNGNIDNCTTKWITDDSRKDLVYSLIQKNNKDNYGKFLKEDGTYDFNKLRTAYGKIPDFWVSATSLAVDCSNKMLKIRFWENADETLEFSF